MKNPSVIYYYYSPLTKTSFSFAPRECNVVVDYFTSLARYDDLTRNSIGRFAAAPSRGAPQQEIFIFSSHCCTMHHYATATTTTTTTSITATTTTGYSIRLERIV